MGTRLLLVASLVAPALILRMNAAQLHAAPAPPPWESITPDADGPGTYHLTLQYTPDDRRLILPPDLPPVITVVNTPHLFPLTLAFNEDASQSWIDWYPGLPGAGTTILLETAERSGQLADGRIVFTAADATVRGDSAKLESHHNNHRVGYWTDVGDYVTWPYKASRWGRYTVELTYSLAGEGQSDIAIDIGDQQVAATLKPTGSWYRYTTVRLDTIYLAKSGDTPVRVRCVGKTGPAVMNLKAVILRPACEGDPPVQADDGVINLHSRDATVRGVMLRYEPQPNKNTLGFWVNEKDTAHWDFTVKSPGRFRVKVFQGCGTDQGGSEAQVKLGDQALNFIVQDTGHFQNFIERDIGEIVIPAPGVQRLTIAPVRKARDAVMDVRQIILEPLAP